MAENVKDLEKFFMKIVVCIKQVLDTGATIQIQDGKLTSPGSSLIMNPYDEFAVEEAIRVKTSLPDTEVTVFSLGPESVKETLKRALAMGADHGVHISDPLFEGLDNFQIAKIILLGGVGSPWSVSWQHSVCEASCVL